MDTILKKLVWPILAIPIIYLAIIWNKLPDQVALHFDLHGNVDRYGSKKELILMITILTAVSAGTYLLLTNIYRIDPKKYAAENKTRLQRMGFGVSVFLTAVLCWVLYSTYRGSIHFTMNFILAAIGLLFAFMGNYMHNIKPNYFAGFRLPWTLENEENWRKTHLLAGRIWFGGGLLVAVACLLIPIAEIALIVFFAITVTMAIIPIIYSYRLYRKQKSSIKQ